MNDGLGGAYVAALLFVQTVIGPVLLIIVPRCAWYLWPEIEK